MKKILVVVDMQNDFIDGALGSKDAENIVDNCVDIISDFDGDIIVTYDTHYDDYMETIEGKKLPVPHCIKGTRGWELNYNIQNALNKKNYHAIEKNTFGSVILPEYIKENYDLENIEIQFIGLCTDICVVSNVLITKACFPEVEISAYSSCMAGVTPDKHNAAIETMKSCHINII